MKRYKWFIIMLNLIFLLIYFNISVSTKEEILNQGKLVLLELVPVDPRSLMQGDYMSLRYTISDSLETEKISKRGFCIVKIDKQGIASRIRFQENRTPLQSNEYLIEYTASDPWNVKIGAESFFFQEGHAEKFEDAKYGALKIDQKGNSVLIGLYDKNLHEIK